MKTLLSRSPFRIDPFLDFGVGFDRLFDDLELLTNFSKPSFPPYNIAKVDENNYEITMALAGFRREDLDINLRDGDLLTVRSVEKDVTEEDSKYTYRGIAKRSFSQTWKIAADLEVVGASMENGLLTVSLRKKQIPENVRQIPVLTYDEHKKLLLENKSA